MISRILDRAGVWFKFWGAGDKQDIINGITVRATDNFNWSFIFILAVVFFLYGYNIWKKNWDVIKAGFALYGVHWLYEIANAIIFKCSGAPLWAVSNDSTTFILLVGVSWELSMMFSLAGMITYMMLPADKNKSVGGYMAENGTLIVSGIIDTRAREVTDVLRSDGFVIESEKYENGWYAAALRKK